MIGVGPADVGGAGTATTASAAGGVEFVVERREAGRDGSEDGRDVRVVEVEGEGGGLGDEGEFSGREREGRRGVAGEELRFKAVEVGFEIDEFVGVGGAAGELGQELVDGPAAGGSDVTAGAKGGDGPLLTLTEEDLIDEIGADIAVVGREVGLEGCVVGGEPAEEDGDELELVDVFGGVASGRVG